MLRPDEWLLEPLEQAVAVDWLDQRDEHCRRDLFCLLMAKNRFRNVVRQWGRFAGPFGLDQDEALTLLEMNAFLQGLCAASGVPYEEVAAAHLEPELDRLRTILGGDDGEPAAGVCTAGTNDN